MVSINFVDTGLDDRILKSIPVDNYPEELMKAVRDRTKLVPKVVVDKNGHRRTVLVRPDKGSNNKGNSGSSSPQTGGPVDISKFSFTNYRNPDGQNRNGYKTYRDSLQSVANATEKAATRVLSTYWGSMKPYDQLRIEFSNINGHSSYRDMISNSSEQGLKDAKSAILARQRELLESVKDYTKWDSSQRKWVKDSAAKDAGKASAKKNSNPVKSDTVSQKSKKLSQMSESELKDRMKQVTTRMSELSKEINSNSKSQGQLNSAATQAQKKEYDELVEENGNLMIELGKRKSTQDTKKDSPSPKSKQSTKKDKPTSQPKSDSKKLSYYKASDATKQKVMKATDGMSGDEVIKMCKDKGIEWEEHSHKGINNMRAKMALAKYFDDGGKLDSSDKKADLSPEDKDTMKWFGLKGTETIDELKNLRKKVQKNMDDAFKKYFKALKKNDSSASSLGITAGGLQNELAKLDRYISKKK